MVSMCFKEDIGGAIQNAGTVSKSVLPSRQAPSDMHITGWRCTGCDPGTCRIIQRHMSMMIV